MILWAFLKTSRRGFSVFFQNLFDSQCVCDLCTARHNFLSVFTVQYGLLRLFYVRYVVKNVCLLSDSRRIVWPLLSGFVLFVFNNNTPQKSLQSSQNSTAKKTSCWHQSKNQRANNSFFTIRNSSYSSWSLAILELRTAPLLFLSKQRSILPMAMAMWLLPWQAAAPATTSAPPAMGTLRCCLRRSDRHRTASF